MLDIEQLALVEAILWIGTHILVALQDALDAVEPQKDFMGQDSTKPGIVIFAPTNLRKIKQKVLLKKRS